MMRALVSTFAILLLLASCATTPSDGTARESLAAGYALIEQTATVARALHEAGAIPDSQRAAIKQRLEVAIFGLDAARRVLDLGRHAEAMQAARAALAPVRTDLEQLQEITP